MHSLYLFSTGCTAVCVRIPRGLVKTGIAGLHPQEVWVGPQGFASLTGSPVMLVPWVYGILRTTPSGSLSSLNISAGPLQQDKKLNAASMFDSIQTYPRGVHQRISCGRLRRERGFETNRGIPDEGCPPQTQRCLAGRDIEMV